MFDYAFKEKLYKVTPAKILRFVKNVYFYNKMDKPPIIIGGSARSGTTLLLSILGAHPAIHAVAFETQAFSLVRPNDNHALNHKQNMKKFRGYLLLEKIKPTARMWCEKTPNNIHHLKRILEEFQGNVKIIHIVRDGRDAITSKHPTKPDQYYIDTAHWVKNAKDGLSVKENPNVYTIRYEDIVENFKPTVAKLLQFLGLEWDDALLQFQSHTTVQNNIAFADGKVSGLSNKSVAKWQNPEHQTVVKAFYENEEAVALMRQLGYEI